MPCSFSKVVPSYIDNPRHALSFIAFIGIIVNLHKVRFCLNTLSKKPMLVGRGFLGLGSNPRSA